MCFCDRNLLGQENLSIANKRLGHKNVSVQPARKREATVALTRAFFMLIFFVQLNVLYMRKYINNESIMLFTFTKKD